MMIKTIGVLLFLTVSSLFAHPHTFIEVYPTVKIENDKVKQIDFQWYIDEMTSSMLIMEFDQNGDGKIDDQESRYIYDEYFSTLAQYDFYSYIEQNRKTIKFPKPENFRCNIRENKIVYSFSIMLDMDKKLFKISFYDKDMFSAMIVKKAFVKVNQGTFIVNDEDLDYTFGYSLELK